jgi:hypothetical protein
MKARVAGYIIGEAVQAVHAIFQGVIGTSFPGESGFERFYNALQFKTRSPFRL